MKIQKNCFCYLVSKTKNILWCTTVQTKHQKSNFKILQTAKGNTAAAQLPRVAGYLPLVTGWIGLEVDALTTTK
jgi:hypothetical protein